MSALVLVAGELRRPIRSLAEAIDGTAQALTRPGLTPADWQRLEAQLSTLRAENDRRGRG